MNIVQDGVGVQGDQVKFAQYGHLANKVSRACDSTACLWNIRCRGNAFALAAHLAFIFGSGVWYLPWRSRLLLRRLRRPRPRQSDRLQDMSRLLLDGRV
jgi:hypothetical protein